jgi:hypothetical protein
VKSKPRNYPIFLYLLTSIILTSCGGGGGGDFNVNFPPLDTFPPVSNPDFEAAEVFSDEVPVVNHTQFNLTGIEGVVSVTGISGATSVMITATKRVQSGSLQDAEAHLQELEVNVQDLATEIRVETIQPLDDGGRNYIVDYTITLPVFLETHVENTGGIVTLDSINNDVTVLNVGGCVNPHLNGGEIPWGSVATSWRKLYEWLSVPQGASLVSSGLLLDPQTAISIQGRQELATHSSLLLAQIQKYTIPQNALRHLYAGFRRHLQTWVGISH